MISAPIAVPQARATALSSSGRVTARVEIFSAKILMTPAARRESTWVSSDRRTVEARAYPMRTRPAGMASAAGGRGSSVQAEPGLRSGGTGTLSAFASCGTSRNRAVWYCAATLPRPVRHGDPAGAAQEDIGQPFASTRRKSSSLTRRSFHGGVSSARPHATTRETPFALFGIWWPGCFTGLRLRNRLPVVCSLTSVVRRRCRPDWLGVMKRPPRRRGRALRCRKSRFESATISSAGRRGRGEVLHLG